MKPVLILRPQPGGDETARRAIARGLAPIVTPLFTVEALEWDAPAAKDFDAILATSANALRCGGADLELYRDLPLFAVGSATADAAQAAGFRDVSAGTGDGNAIAEQAAATGKTRLLHLAGRNHILVDPAGISIERRIVYAADPVDALPAAAHAALQSGTVTLLHSPRAARLFAALVDAAQLDRSTIIVAAISLAVRTAAGGGWAHADIAERPDDNALLAAAARLCDQYGAGSGTSQDEDRA